MKKISQKTLGKIGENIAINLFQKQGYTICEKNYLKSCGEIDIIAYKKDLIIFCEVKTRINPLFDMTELITASKQKKIINTAKIYCIEKHIIDKICRFDVALITGTTPENLTCQIIENAFTERE